MGQTDRDRRLQANGLNQLHCGQENKKSVQWSGMDRCIQYESLCFQTEPNASGRKTKNLQEDFTLRLFPTRLQISKAEKSKEKPLKRPTISPLYQLSVCLSSLFHELSLSSFSLPYKWDFFCEVERRNKYNMQGCTWL